MTASVALPFQIGARTVWQLRRRLARLPLTLEEAREGRLPALPPLDPGADGYLITSLNAAVLPPLREAHPRLRAFVRQRYRRSYAVIEGSFDEYLAAFSAKSRSTLRRKVRKLAERSGGSLDVRTYSRPDEMEEFYRHARAVSATTYQEKLLDAGLPEGEETLAAMRSLASRDSVRGWLLFVAGVAVSYLYAPADGATLLYAHLGYDPAFADLSPGTVLQFEAMRRLFAEGRFRLFDFTAGDGQHKRQFSTGGVDCADVLLLKPTLANLSAARALDLFDRSVALAKQALKRLGLEGLGRKVTR